MYEFFKQLIGLKKWILLIKTLALAIQIVTAKVHASAIVKVITTAIVTVIAQLTILVIVN